MDILGRESFAFDDHTNVHLVAGAGYAARERHQFKESTPPEDITGGCCCGGQLAMGGSNLEANAPSFQGGSIGTWRRALEVLGVRPDGF
jgi:hypothetical protein